MSHKSKKHYFHSKTKSLHPKASMTLGSVAQKSAPSLAIQFKLTYPNFDFKLFKKLIFHLAPKAIILANILLLTVLPLSSALPVDSEIAADNRFQASTLDMTVTTANPNFSNVNGNLLPGDAAAQSATWSKTSTSSAFSYSQKVENFSGNADLCNALELNVWHHYFDNTGTLIVDEKYSGLLSAFNINSLGTDPNMSLPNNPYFANPVYTEDNQLYFYEVTLPDNTNPALGSSTCGFDITGSAWQFDPTLTNGYWDTETFASTITTGSWANISGMKFNDQNGNGLREASESGLPNWTIYAGREFQKIDIEATNSAAYTTNPLTDNTTYLIRVTGTFNAGAGINADAKYSNTPAENSDWTDSVLHYETYGPTLLDFQIDDTSPALGAYQSDHEYWTSYEGQGVPLSLSIYDIYYPGNTGRLNVTIFETILSDITDENGHYELDYSGVTGETVVAEEMQAGWQQTFPTKGVYTFTTPAIYENRDFGNQEIPAPLPDLSKIVINEVYEDATNSAEWVELYNSGTTPVSASAWTIEDGNSSDTLPDFNLNSGEFAVIVTNGVTPGLLTRIASYSAQVIQLDNPTIGSGLNDLGDLLRLRDDSNQVVDELSWGNNTTIFNMLNIPDNQSIYRSPLGLDTDAATDWHINTNPNPGHDPDSPVQVNLNQEDNNLIIGMTQANVFDLVEYVITYNHVYEGATISEAVQGQRSKPLNQVSLNLSPIYFGTCSTNGSVCTPHTSITNVQITLTYQNGLEVIGTSNLNYTWQ